MRMVRFNCGRANRSPNLVMPVLNSTYRIASGLLTASCLPRMYNICCSFKESQNDHRVMPCRDSVQSQLWTSPLGYWSSITAIAYCSAQANTSCWDLFSVSATISVWHYVVLCGHTQWSLLEGLLWKLIGGSSCTPWPEASPNASISGWKLREVWQDLVNKTQIKNQVEILIIAQELTFYEN